MACCNNCLVVHHDKKLESKSVSLLNWCHLSDIWLVDLTDILHVPLQRCCRCTWQLSKWFNFWEFFVLFTKERCCQYASIYWHFQFHPVSTLQAPGHAHTMHHSGKPRPEAALNIIIIISVLYQYAHFSLNQLKEYISCWSVMQKKQKLFWYIIIVFW